MLTSLPRYHSIDISPHDPSSSTNPYSYQPFPPTLPSKILKQLSQISISNHPKAFVSAFKKQPHHKSLDNRMGCYKKAGNGLGVQKAGGYCRNRLFLTENHSTEISQLQLPPILKGKSTSGRERGGGEERGKEKEREKRREYSSYNSHPRDHYALSPNPTDSLSLHPTTHPISHHHPHPPRLITQQLQQLPPSISKQLPHKIYRKSKPKQNKNPDLFTKEGWNNQTRGKWLASFCFPK